jgi:RNA polymerase sigma factor (TIGR02999 family)
MATDSTEVSALLAEYRQGSPEALERLLPIVYQELRRLAAYQLCAERPGHTLQPTALVHEAYLRLVGRGDQRVLSRAHFFALAASVMRHVLVDHARARVAGKRGGGATRVELEDADLVPSEREADLVALDDSLTSLARLSERQARIVELRFFAGLTNEEIADVLGLAPMKVRREWNAARLWLWREMARSERRDA